MADGGWLPAYIFISMIAMADKDGYVKAAPKALFRRIGFREYDNKISFKDFETAIKFLTDEDMDSNLPAHHGKRIIPMSEMPDIEDNRGWWIVNYKHYRDKGTSTDRVRRYRENNNLKNDVTDSTFQSVSETHTDTDTDTDKDINIQALQDFKQHRKEIKKPLTSRAEKIAITKMKSLSLNEQREMIDQTIANGWTGLFPPKKEVDEEIHYQ